MEVIHARCAGIDVHKKEIVVAPRVAEGPTVQRDLRTFGTTTKALLQASDWLRELGITHVAMESTGPYWRPVWHVLEGSFELTLANARDVKNVPGRKSDAKDPEWLADLHAHGLIRDSFVPDTPFLELRDLTRTRAQLLGERTRQVQRIQKILEYANVKLSSVVTDIMGVSGRRMLRALIEGESDPERLAALGHARLKATKAELREALHGRVTEHHRFMLRLHLDHVTEVEGRVQELEARIERYLQPFQRTVVRLDAIPGIDQAAAAVIVAEMGVDMSRFPTHGHLLAWAGVSPGLNESGGKRKSSRIRPGDRWLKTTLVQAAWAAVKKKDSFFHAKFLRIRRRRGEKKAIVAVAASMLTAAYYMIRDNKDFHDLGADYLTRLDRDKIARTLIRRLTDLGLDVQVRAQAA